MSFVVPGLPTDCCALLDERSSPDFRAVFGTLVAAASDVAVAVTRVRLTTLDLTAPELGHVESMRVIVAELSALALDAEARLLRSDPRRAERVALYRGLLESGRLEVRAAPLGGWSPDFTVFSDAGGPGALLVGGHWFERPFHRGPSLASLHRGDAARLAARRHAELWDRAHDIGPALWSILSRAERSGRLMETVAGTVTEDSRKAYQSESAGPTVDRHRPGSRLTR